MKHVIYCCACALLSCSLFAQVHEGSWGMGASMALPSGISSMVVSNAGSGNTGSAVGNLSSFTYTGGSEFAYQMSPSLQLDGGIGIGLVSFGVSNGTAADSRSTISINVGARNYLKPGNDVSPYIGGNLSYSIIPTVNSGNAETSGNLMMVGVCFGVEAFIAKHAALYSQMGVGYTSGSVTMKTSGVTATTFTGSVNTISLGGSAIGFRLYWN